MRFIYFICFFFQFEAIRGRPECDTRSTYQLSARLHAPAAFFIVIGVINLLLPPRFFFGLVARHL